MLVARPYEDVARFQAAAANLIAGLAPSADGAALASPPPAAARPA
jgi:hypothetical protein